MFDNPTSTQPVVPVNPTSADSNTFKEMSIDDLTSILDTTIKCDKINKCIVFLGMLSAYTEEDQLNICLLGESSSGKTYIAQQTAMYFPQEDVVRIAEATPKAFKYLDNAREMDFTPDEDDDGNERRTIITDLERVILLFQDMPNTKFLHEVRPLLSHDQKELMYYSVNQSNQGRKKTESLILRGYPSVVFCSANIRVNPQEATRCLLLSPETSDEKIEASMGTTIERYVDPKKYIASVESDPRRKALRERVKRIKQMYIQSVIVPFSKEYILERYRTINPVPAPSDNRNIQHILSLIKAVAMLNAGNRLGEKHEVIANESDVEAGFKLWNGIAKTQDCGIAPTAMSFYEKYLVPAYLSYNIESGISIAELLRFCKQNGCNVAPYTVSKDFVPTLILGGLISYGPVEGRDGRGKYMKPLTLPKLPKAEAETIIPIPREEESPFVVSPDSLNRENLGF